MVNSTKFTSDTEPTVTSSSLMDSCGKTSESWMTAAKVFLAFFLLILLFCFIFIIFLISNPTYARVVERDQEVPAEDAPLDYIKASWISALIAVGVFLILAIAFSCTSCRKKE